MFIKAESVIVFNNPVMMAAVYTCIILISWIGAKMIVVNSLTTGELMSHLLHEHYDEPHDALHGFCHDHHEYRKC